MSIFYKDDNVDEEEDEDDTESTGETIDWDFIGDSSDKDPYNIERHCTDVRWLVVWLCAMGGFFCLTVAWVLGTRYTVFEEVHYHFGSRRLCDAGNFTFFCQNASGGLMLRMPRGNENGYKLPALWRSVHTCVEECPVSSEAVPGCGGKGSGTLADGYESELVFQLICRPTEDEYDLQDQFLDWQADHWDLIFMRTTQRHRGTILTTSLVSIFVSYVSFWFFYLSVESVVKLGLLLFAFVPTLTGLWLSGILFFVPGVDGVLPYPPEEDAYEPLSFLLFIIGMTFIGVMCFMQEQVHRAIGCMEMAFKLVGQVRAIVVHPMLMSFVFFLVMVMHYVAYLVKCAFINHGGERTTLRSVADVLLVTSLYMHGQGIISYSELVVNYITAVWCFNGGIRHEGHVTKHDLLRAYWIPVRYHLGTIFFGSLVVGLLRPVRMTVGSIVRFLTLRTNPLKNLLGSCCGPCFAAWNRWVEPLSSKGAFIDVAMTGRPFCSAARQAARISGSQDHAVQILSGATRILQAVFLGLNMGACWGLVLIQRRPAHWNSSAAVLLGVLSTCFSAALALPFAMLFDTVSDAILYCITVDMEIERRKKVVEEPTALPCIHHFGALTSLFGGWSSLFEDDDRGRSELASFTEVSESRDALLSEGATGVGGLRRSRPPD